MLRLDSIPPYLDITFPCTSYQGLWFYSGTDLARSVRTEHDVPPPISQSKCYAEFTYAICAYHH